MDCSKGEINVTAFYVGLDVVTEGWLVVVLGQQFTSFLDARMTGQRIVVVTANHLRSNGFGYKQ